MIGLLTAYIHCFFHARLSNDARSCASSTDDSRVPAFLATAKSNDKYHKQDNDENLQCMNNSLAFEEIAEPCRFFVG